MKLEAIDPLNLSSICVATVMDVLNYGYIMIRIDTYESDVSGTGIVPSEWFLSTIKKHVLNSTFQLFQGPIGFVITSNRRVYFQLGFAISTTFP